MKNFFSFFEKVIQSSLFLDKITNRKAQKITV